MAVLPAASHQAFATPSSVAQASATALTEVPLKVVESAASRPNNQIDIRIAIEIRKKDPPDTVGKSRVDPAEWIGGTYALDVYEFH